MKNHAKKALALTLSFVLLLACGIPAFAATKETVTKFGEAGGYLAIGDSISRGCGAEGFYIDQDKAEGGQYDEFFLRNVQGAVPTQIAEAVGCVMPDDMEDQNATFWPCCYPGMTVAMMLDLLGVDDGFTDEKLNYAYYGDMLKYFGYEGSFDGVRDGDTYVEGECGKCGNIIDLIQRADLITLQLGMCDIFYRTYRIISNGGMLADGLNFDLSSTDAIKELVTTAIKEMWFGYNYWLQNYTTLLSKIQELNPDATIVMVGSFNVVNELTITDEILLPLGNVISVITDLMNTHYRDWEKEYNVLYADVSNTEVLSAENDWSLLGEFMDNTFTGTHPSQTGYDYMVRQILAVLPPETVTKGITVDLGRYDKVDYVYVDGLPMKNYTVENYILHVPYRGLVATNLTVGVKNEDGTISVQSYSLTYSNGTYVAHRIGSRNDVVDTVTKPAKSLFDLLKSLFQKIADFFKNLFNKN